MRHIELGYVFDENHVVDARQFNIVRWPVGPAADGLEGEASRAPPRHLQRHLQHVPID